MDPSLPNLNKFGRDLPPIATVTSLNSLTSKQGFRSANRKQPRHPHSAALQLPLASPNSTSTPATCVPDDEDDDADSTRRRKYMDNHRFATRTQIASSVETPTHRRDDSPRSPPSIFEQYLSAIEHHYESPASCKSQSIPERTALRTSPKSFPDFSHFSACFFAAYGLNVLLNGKDKIALYDAPTQSMIAHRDQEFHRGAASNWEDVAFSPDLARSVAYFSRATLKQRGDTEKSSWFIDEFGEPMTIQSQLLPHVYSGAQSRDVVENHFGRTEQEAGKCLDQTLDLGKYTESRRIQNSMRRLLEMMITFVLDLIVRSVLEECSPHDLIPSSVAELWASDSETMGQLQMYVLCRLDFLRETLDICWETIAGLCETCLPPFSSTASSSRSSQISRLSSSDSMERSTIASINSKAFIMSLDYLHLIPPELNFEDLQEVIEAIILSTSSAQLQCARHESLSTMKITKEKFIQAFSLVPFNCPDFPAEGGQDTYANLVAKDDINGILKRVVAVAARLSRLVCDQSERMDPDEKTLSGLRVAASVQGTPSASQMKYSERISHFVAQDFLQAHLISVEEIQILLASAGVGRHTFDYHSVAYQTVPVTSLSAGCIRILSFITRVARSFRQDKEMGTSLLESLHIIELAIELIVGMVSLHLSSSEKFTIRNVLGPLAISLNEKDIIARFGPTLPLPIPDRSNLPRSGANQMAMEENAQQEHRVLPAHVAYGRWEVVKESEARKRLCEECPYEDVIKKQDWVVTEKAAFENDRRCEGSANDSSGKAIEVDDDLIPALVILHAPETHQAMRKLSPSTTNEQASRGKIQLSLASEGLRQQCSETWRSFWTKRASELTIDSVALTGAPLRWSSLYSLCSLYDKVNPFSLKN